MGFFGNIIKNGITGGISNALEKSVSKVVVDKVAPTIYKKTNEVADATVESIYQVIRRKWICTR